MRRILSEPRQWVFFMMYDPILARAHDCWDKIYVKLISGRFVFQ